MRVTDEGGRKSGTPARSDARLYWAAAPMPRMRRRGERNEEDRIVLVPAPGVGQKKRNENRE
jgi:hypothetical protein